MWFVERKQRGVDPPHVLTANMVPPSMRSIVPGVDLQPQEVKPTYSNPELEMISNEIEELARERRALETEIAQKEADVRIKNGEVRSLQVCLLISLISDNFNKIVCFRANWTPWRLR